MSFDINTAQLDEESSIISTSNFDVSTATIDEQEELTAEHLRSIPAQLVAPEKPVSYLEPLDSSFKMYDKPKNFIEAIQQAFYWTTQVPVSAFKSGYNNINVADLEMKGIYSGKELDAANLNKLQELENKSFGRYNRNNNYQIIKPNYNQKDPYTITGAVERLTKGLPNFFKTSYAETISQFPLLIETMKTGGIGSGIGATIGAAVGSGGALIAGNLGPQAATPEEVVTVPAAAIAGAKKGALIGGRFGAAKRIFELEAGLSKNELRAINQEIIAEGGEPLNNQELNLFAIGVGGANAGLELVALEKLLETVPNGKQILDKLKNKQLKALVKNPTVRQQMLDVLKKYGTAALAEASTEAAQEATNIIANEKVRQLGELEATPLVDNVKRIIEAGSVGFGVALFMGGVGSAAQAVNILKHKGSTQQEAEQIVSNMSIDEQLQFVNDNADALIQSVMNSPEFLEQEAVEKLRENYFNQLKAAGADDVVANQTASLYALGFAKLAKDSGKSINEIAETNISFKNLTEDEAVKQYNQGFNQVPQDVEPKFQADNIDAEKNIQDNFGSSSEELQEMFKADVLNILQENMLDESEFSFEAIRLYGSYTKGKNKATSDIDVLVQYSGSMKEDAAFNMLNEQGLTITDVNGNEVKVDINPINVETSGTIDEHIAQMNQYEKEDNPNIYFQGGNLEFEVDESFDLNKYIKSLNVKKNIKKSSENFAEKLELILDDKLASGVEPIVLFKPTKILTRVGIPDAKIVFKQGKIKKVLNEHLTIEDLKKIPELLANPEYIFESATDENGFVVVLTREERPLIVAITKVGKEFKIKNIIKSAYNKGVNFVSDNIKEGRLLYDKSNPTRFRQHRASIAQAKTLSDNNIITDSESDFKPSETVNDDRNLIMAHASRLSNINEIIEVGSLIAPSFSITSKESETLEEGKFGEVLFIRNPKKIDYQNDNIYDRDIYSPRMPMPHYDIPNGRTVDYYEYDSLKRSYESNPEKFVEKWGATFDEYFKGAKKVLFLGYTPSGNRRYVPYNSENILKEMKKHGLLNKEGFDYGLSSLLARFSSKQTNKTNLKETAKTGLSRSKDIDKLWEDIKEEYDKLGEKVAEYYYDKWSFYEVQSEAFYAIAKNMRKTINDLFTEEIPAEIKQEVKDFVEKAKNLPRSYFEAKPMREVGLSEFNNVLVKKGTLTEKQKKGLESWGVKVTEYKKGELYKTLENLDKENENIYFQEDEDSNEANTEESIRNAKGFFYEKKAFDGTPKENIVVLIKNKADASTLIHEFAHIYLQTLNNLARTSDKAKQQLLTVNKWLRYDGKEYTTAQHEKFADGFVAYVKSGKAPSYGLKRVFENFRRWLSDIYNNIVTNENVELDNETKKVFDELLGDLSVNQQEKLSEEIIAKARDNAELRMRDELVEKGNVKFNELTDKQRRYRDTAYDIIFYALKHSKNEETRNYVQNISDLRMKLGSGNTKSLQRQFERIELLLAETDDAFSAHDGFLPEWGEFFNDTGVSYDNLQQGADAELALNAFEVIRDKKYLYDESFEELSENDIKKAQYELEYIINEYKYAEDKSVPMSAFFTWIDSQHPYIQDELLKQWENETNEIDRYQALSKFEQAKEDLKLKAAQMQGLGDYSMQFAEYARAIIKRLDFMTEKDKARIFDKLKDFNSFKEVQANLDDVMDFAQTLYNVTERRKIADDILREVKGTIHEWKDGIKRTKYTYPANKLFARLRELNNLPLEDIKDLYDAQVNEEIKPTYEADAVNTDDYYETIEKMFIEFKANGVYYNSTAFLQDLLTRVQNAKFTAKIARDEMDFERRMQAINLVDEAAKAVSKHKGKASKLEQVYRYGFNLNNALEMMFDKNIKSKFSLDYLYAQKDAKVGADRDVVLNKLKENFGFKGVMADTFLFNKFIDMTKKEFKITQRYSPDIAQGVIRETHRDKETGKVFTDKKINYAKDAERSEWQPEEIELSRMEVLYYYIQSLNEESYKILTDMGSETQAPKGQFDKYEFDEMINQLTEQEKMMGLILQQAAEKYYDELNRYHIKKYHTELGKVKNYFPRKTELTEVKPLELFSDYANYSGVLSAQKQRTANAGARIAPANALAVLFQHMEKANTLIVMGEQLDLMNRVFKDQSLKKKVEIVWGIDTAKEFYNQIAGNLYSGQASMLSDAENLIGRIENNVIKAQIFAKAQVGLKQIISFLNYGTGDEFVSTAEWNAAFWKQSFTPKEWKNNIDYMMNIPYLKDRFGRGGSTDALKRQLEQRMFAKMSLLDDFFSLPIKIGDMGAIILGGKPYIDALITKGYTEEQALKIFIEKTVNEMQSSIPSTMSNLQRNAAKQPLAKMFFAYQNTPWQYFRVAAMSMIQFKQNPNVQTGLNMAKLTGLYMFVFPLIFNLASSLSLVTGDEDELQNDIWKSVIGGVTFVPLAGMFINAMLSGFLGERVSTGNWFDTAASKTGNIARKMAKGDDITAVDLLKALALFGEAGTGLPLTSIGTEVAGVYDVATGAPAKGILKVAGYSDYRAKKISGEED